MGKVCVSFCVIYLIVPIKFKKSKVRLSPSQVLKSFWNSIHQAPEQVYQASYKPASCQKRVSWALLTLPVAEAIFLPTTNHIHLILVHTWSCVTHHLMNQLPNPHRIHSNIYCWRTCLTCASYLQMTILPLLASMILSSTQIRGFWCFGVGCIVCA